MDGKSVGMAVAMAWLALPGALRAAAPPSPIGTDGAVLAVEVTHGGTPDPIGGAVVRASPADSGPAAWTREGVTDTKGSAAVGAPAGLWRVSACADGYGCVTRTVRLKPGRRRTLRLGLEAAAMVGDMVQVRGRRRRPQPVEATVSRDEIKQIAGTFGDALRAVQLLPGVAKDSDYSGAIMVQGAGPNDNLYLLDAIPWPIPFHFGGLVSTVNPDLLGTVDLDEAGYGARWGGSLAAVLNAHTRPPTPGRLHVDADVSLLQASVLLQGSLGVGDATYALSGRRSYFDLLGRALKTSAVPDYWDSQGVVDFHAGPHNSFHILAMGSDDTLDFNGSFGSGSNAGFSGTIHYNQDYESGGLDWTNTSLGSVVSVLTPYAYHVGDTMGVDQVVDNNTRTVGGLKEEARWDAGRFLGASNGVGAGGEVELADYGFNGFFPRVTTTATSFSNLTSLPDVASTVDIQGVDGYAYLLDRLQWRGPWALTLGGHYDTSNLLPQGEFGPRVSLEFKPDPDDDATLAWGRYDQTPSALNLNPQFGNAGLSPQLAEHLVLSYERKLGAHLDATADAYYKNLHALVVSDPGNPALYDNQGLGTVTGADFSLKETLGDSFFGWITYSWSDSQRLNLPSQAWGLYEYDQPDILNVVSSYSPNERWTFGETLRCASGNLIEPAGSQVYSQRLPAYVRLDLRATRTWKFPQWTLDSYFEIINVLDRANPAQEFVAPNGQTDVVDDLPLLPNVGVEAKY